MGGAVCCCSKKAKPAYKTQAIRRYSISIIETKVFQIDEVSCLIYSYLTLLLLLVRQRSKRDLNRYRKYIPRFTGNQRGNTEIERPKSHFQRYRGFHFRCGCREERSIS